MVMAKPNPKMKTWQKRLLWVFLLIIIIGLLSYYLYFTVSAQPVLLTKLATYYSFDQLVNLAISVLGKVELFALITGFIALAAFFTSIPSSGGFATLSPRIAGLFLVNLIATWALGILILFGLRIFPSILASTILLYGPLAILALIAWPSSTSDPTYAELTQNRQNSLAGTADTLFMKRMIAPNVLLVIVLGELAYFANNNPSFPLLAWFLLGYALVGAVLIIAQAEGYAYLITTAKYARLTPTEGQPYEGFIVSKGNDHYLIRTKERIFLVQSSGVREIQILKKPISLPSHRDQ